MKSLEAFFAEQGSRDIQTLAQYQAQYNDPAFASDNDLKRFLEQSSWGQRGDDTDFTHLRAIGIRVDWLDEDDIAARFSFRRPAALLSHDAAQVVRLPRH